MNSSAVSRPFAAASLLAHVPLLLALALRLASGTTADLSYFAVAAYALLGRRQLILALALSFLFTMVNPALAPTASFATVGRYLVLAAATLSAVLHGPLSSAVFRVRPLVLGTVALGVFILAHSLLFSRMADVSALKAIAWTLATASLLSAWSGLSPAQQDDLADCLRRAFVSILLVSLLFCASPLGYLRNGSGFQGILNHPQAFGATVALLGAWTFARILAQRRPSWGSFALFTLCCAAVLMSEARTAGFAMVIGVALALLANRCAPGRAGGGAPGLMSRRLWAVLAILALAAPVLLPALAASLDRYVAKSGRAQVVGILDAYQVSRGRLAEAMLANVAETPLTGIGFGVASRPSTMVVERDAVLGLPVGASVEKGIAPLAVLEELGVVGAVVVAVWVMALVRRSARAGLPALSVCLTGLLLNLGESTLFSPGGMGLLALILFGWAQARDPSKDARRHG